jgi:hypothetical protein
VLAPARVSLIAGSAGKPSTAQTRERFRLQPGLPPGLTASRAAR